jgi:isopenicillin N synthase-like dioxygenase
MSGESLDPSLPGDPKEAFNIGPAYPTLQPLPPPLDTNAELITRFQNSCHELCRNILGLLGTALKINDEGYLSDRHDQAKGPSGTIFRMLYYPQTSQKEDTQSIRAGAHSDYGSLTLLFRLPGQSGLQLLTPTNTWVDVPVSPPSTISSAPPILVNIGDLLSYWTNGLLKSTVHRVTFSGGQERYSMAYFCHPLDEARLEAVPSKVIEGVGEKGREELGRQRERLGVSGDEGIITAKEHLERRLRVTYGI